MMNYTAVENHSLVFETQIITALMSGVSNGVELIQNLKSHEIKVPNSDLKIACNNLMELFPLLKANKLIVKDAINQL